jgi:hypothetical protein
MRERKPYPNISDEELDRRAEEALKRMLANPKNQGLVGATTSSNHGQGHGQGGQGGQSQGGQGGQGGQGPGNNPNNQNRQGRRKRRNRPQR